MLNDDTTIKLEDDCELNMSVYKDKQLLKSCVSDIKDKLEIKPVIFLYGRQMNQSRNVGFYSDATDGFEYSGTTMKSRPLTNNLKLLMESINEQFGANFNGILINEYIDGSNRIGAHSDNMKMIDPNVGVVSVSYGSMRHFVVRDKSTKSVVAKVCANSGSIIHMNGTNFQKKYTHEIPETKSHVGTRYSFTFRCHGHDI